MQLNKWDKELNNLALLDEDFLVALQEQRERELYARVAALDFEEKPIDYIEGQVTSGSINIDGDSAIRRTCSLSMIAEELNIKDVYWGVKTKVSIEIGLKNEVDENYGTYNERYPDIIWFPQGKFILTTFNTSLQTKGYSISLQGKDKMAMLNGDLGGQLFASVDFGQEEESIKTYGQITLDDTNSESIIAGQYYIKPTIEELVNVNEVFITDYPNEMVYGFEKNEDGNFYKFENKYIKITGTTVLGVAQQKYQIYKKVMTPREVFISVNLNSQQYTPGKYYYKPDANNEYYILDSNKGYIPSRDYYSLRDIYKVEYTITKKKIPLDKIIREAVHAYAREPYWNIVIKDLDDYGLEQLTYKGDTTLYALRHRGTTGLNGTNEFVQMFFLHKANYLTYGTDVPINSSSFNVNTFHLDNLSEIDNSADLVYSPSNPSIKYSIAPINYGDDVGYRITDLTYAGDLVTSVGDTLVTMLDKIKEMLGDFEYFYDLNGRFVFQRKPNYVNVSWSQIMDNGDETYVSYGNDKRKFAFSFEGNRLVTAVQNAPALNNLRNDFSVWGKRKGVSDSEIPIHARFAIDHKPKEYFAFNGVLYYTQEAVYAPSPEQADLIGITQEQTAAYQQDISLIPSFLMNQDGRTSYWWELMDWAHYYMNLTGVYPSQKLMSYQTAGFSGTINFNGSTQALTNQLIIDVSRTTGQLMTRLITKDGQIKIWNPTQHKYGTCKHTYAEYLNMYETYPDLISFIYKPVIPDDTIIIDDGGELPSVLDARLVDWRELIYRMAIDYFAASQEYATLNNRIQFTPVYDKDNNLVLDNPDHFLTEVGRRNPYYYPTGYTGYEQYYTDMQGFWRQLYNPDYTPKEVYKAGYYETTNVHQDDSVYFMKQRTWRDAEISDIEIEYYTGFFNESARKLYNSYFGSSPTNVISDTDLYNKLRDKFNYYYITDQSSSMANRLYWNRKVFEAPEQLNFWIDFLDDVNELAQFSIPSVGDRSKTVKEDKVKAIFYKEVPGLILVSNEADKEDWVNREGSRIDEIREQSGYVFAFLPKGMAKYFEISYRGLSAKDKIDELLYQYSYCVENVTITALPVYHLQPNTRIYVRDDTTNINGEYLISKMTIPLDHKSTMSITASKAPNRLY